jgi:hypothetical protein
MRIFLISKHVYQATLSEMKLILSPFSLIFPLWIVEPFLIVSYFPEFLHASDGGKANALVDSARGMTISVKSRAATRMPIEADFSEPRESEEIDPKQQLLGLLSVASYALPLLQRNPNQNCNSGLLSSFSLVATTQSALSGKAFRGRSLRRPCSASIRARDF